MNMTMNNSSLYAYRILEYLHRIYLTSFYPFILHLICIRISATLFCYIQSKRPFDNRKRVVLIN